ncbi:MAG: aminotransferase class V-fold PLP-dependent enzyme, partial [Hyphomicrobiales bacterium]
MSGVRSYLDHNATAPLRAEARAAMLDALDAVGNPSSIHAEGRAARGRIEAARDQVARLCGASPRDVVFTGGATEANVTALTLGLKTDGDPRPFTHLLISAVEHPSGLEGARVPKDAQRILPVDGEGLLNLTIFGEELNKINTLGGRALVSIQAANSETGVIQPIPA